jgi:hypothetical protein
MRHYDELAVYQRSGFEVIVDKSWEDLNPRDCFDFEEDEELFRKIEDGTYEWFMLRVRVLVDSHEMGSHYLGGCCYEDAREVLTDGTAEDCIEEALREAKEEVQRLAGKLYALQMEIDYADAQQ